MCLSTKGKKKQTDIYHIYKEKMYLHEREREEGREKGLFCYNG